ncbi:MAG: hypothetical protein U1A77_04825 [Pirellulales bacterium]
MSTVSSPPWSRFDLACLIGVLLLAFALRVPQLGEPLWIDELHTGWVVIHGLDDLPDHAWAGNQSSLWFYLPWLTTRWHTSAIALRLPSIIAGLAVLPLLYEIARRVTGSSLAALAAALLAALDSRFAFYGVEARAYACVQCFALLHFAAWLYRDVNSAHDAARKTIAIPGGISSTAWIGSGVALFYLHYTTALLLVAELIFDAVAVRRDSALLRRRIFEYALVAIACIPAAAHLRTIAQHRDDWSQTLAADTLTSIVPWYLQLAAPAVVLITSLALRWFQRRRPLFQPPKFEPTLRLVLWITIPCLAALLATHFGIAQLLRYRYLIGAMTLVPLVAAIALAILPHQLGRVMFLFTVVALATFEHPGLSQWRRGAGWPAERTESWDKLVARINESRAESTRPVLLCPALVEDRRLAPTDETPRPSKTLVEFCRFPLESLYRLDDRSTPIIPLPTLTQPRLTARSRQQLGESSGAWLIARGDENLARYIVRQLNRELRDARRTPRIQKIESFGGVTLVELSWQTSKPQASPKPPVNN